MANAFTDWLSRFSSKGKLFQPQYENTQKSIDQYTGNNGYNNGLQQGKQGAADIARGAASQALGGLRSSGYSKGKAGMEAGQAGAQAYQNNISSQQDKAMQSGLNNVNAQGTLMGAAQAEDTNRYNKSWGNLGNIIGTAGNIASTIAAISDERLKKYHEVGEKLCEKDPNKWKKLVWNKGDKE